MGQNETSDKKISAAISTGAIWMIAVRWSIKGLGLISSIILARLLSPSDFGLVAMAMSVYALIGLIREFGFSNALIQNQDAKREDYDTAWTLQFLLSALVCLLLILFAYPAAQYYEDPRLEPILYVFALVALLFGFHNIATVDYQKDMQFDSVFILNVTPKVCSFIVTVSAAVYFRSYWALVIGQASNLTVTLVMSYWLHSFRPRLTLKRWRKLLGFSSWLLLNNFVKYMNRHGKNFIITKYGGAPVVGLVTIAQDFATLIAMEVVSPINTAAYPGYSKVASSATELGQTFLEVLEVVAILAIPGSIGLAVIAPVFVPVVLGDQWLAAVQLMPLIALGSIFFAFANSVDILLMAVGKQRITTLLVSIRLLIFLSLMVYALPNHGAIGVGYAYLVSNAVVVPFYFLVTTGLLVIDGWDIFVRLVRPIAASIVMAVVVVCYISGAHDIQSDLFGVWLLLKSVLVGFAAFLACTVLLVSISSREDSVERRAARRAFRLLKSRSNVWLKNH